ncbi:FHA domain-containing protein [Gemmatimonas groenlandica]|uniref:FHA domain-containing protein n=1 Tax=Gemmatimonas groenlandica TaxID=2732249 RepID=A0A6M4IJD5_9BACT|nr:FHA domain-containing protein [Gemmatimonas groenlandica]QJR34730.1 FHA domain-containing protein [Gemmatimonas groenlandica]
MSYGLVFGALLAVLCFIAFIGGLVWWVRRPISGRRHSSGALPLFGHDRAVVYARAEDDDDEVERAQLIMARAPHWSAATNGAAATASSAAGNGVAHHADRVPSRSARTASPNRSAPASRTEYAPLPDVSMPDVSMPAATEFDGRSIRYSVPTDSTLQFLPGRLEVISGPDVGREIRFVRTPGRDAIEVTFGRNEGPPYRHVQLHDATVSRAHARMRYRDGQWLLSNLSATNPVLRNGLVLDGDGDVDLALAEGDRIEMGEVVFRFHV